MLLYSLIEGKNEVFPFRFLAGGAGDGGVCVSRVFTGFRERLIKVAHNRWTKVSELGRGLVDSYSFRRASQEDHEIFDIVSALEASEGPS